MKNREKGKKGGINPWGKIKDGWQEAKSEARGPGQANDNRRRSQEVRK
jgi:hypothetical protein